MPRPGCISGCCLFFGKDAQSFFVDVLSRVAVAIVMCSAFRAIPCADAHVLDFLVLEAAGVTKLTGREEFPDMDDGCPEFRADVFQKADEFGETIVRNFLPMPHLHPLHVEVFEADDGILLAEGSRQFPMERPPLVRHAAMQPCKFQTRFFAVVRAHPLAGQLAIRLCNGILLLSEEGWFGDVVLRILCDQHRPFQAEIETDAFTHSGFSLGFGRVADEIYKEVSASVPLDREELDCPFDVAALGKLVLTSGDLDDVSFDDGAPDHVVREGAVFPPTLELRRRGLPLVLQVLPEELVAALDAVGDVLNGVGRDVVPERKARELLELREVFLEGKLGKRLMIELPVAAMERDGMIVDLACDPKLVIQPPRLLRAIELEFEGLHVVQLLVFCVSTYRWMVALHTSPAVETK